ncbi:MAG: glutaredoxin family protein [Thermodesulfobacteriota bacterium]
MAKPLVEVFARKDCELCDCPQGENCTLCRDAAEVINRARVDIPFEFKEVDICASEDLFRRYKEDIPTVFINGKKVFKYKVDEAEFRRKTRKEIIRDGILRLRSRKASSKN